MSKDNLRIVNDNDGHTYMIPIELEEEFDLWLENPDDLDEKRGGTNFPLYQINGYHTLIIHDYTDEA